jgi:hypothetical protein
MSAFINFLPCRLLFQSNGLKEAASIKGITRPREDCSALPSRPKRFALER